MSPLFAIIFVLIIFFILICLECVLRKKISYVVESFNEDDAVTELKIRETLIKYPASEIVILCTTENSETAVILEKLQADFPQLHIIK